jgi:hypothetical protein
MLLNLEPEYYDTQEFHTADDYIEQAFRETEYSDTID